ncbi:MAG: alpha/beta hydrolase [Bacillota bacterium]
MKSKTFKRILGYSLLGIFIIIIGYSTLVYRADSELVEDVDGYEVSQGSYTFITEDATANIVLYPGGLVHPEAYLELGSKLSKSSFNVYIPKMPFHFPLLDSDIVFKIGMDETLPTFIGGHSLGGVAAARAVDEHEGEFAGLFLLASYPEEGIDLRERDIPVLSLIASNDGIMNRDAYQDGVTRLNQDRFNEVSIPGGNHAYFGSYGEQSGDNEATITRTMQLEFTATLVQNFIRQNLE